MNYREFLKESCNEFAFKPSDMTEEDRERLYDFLEDLNDAHPHSAFKNRKCKTCAKERFTGASPYKCDGCRNGSAYKPNLGYELKTNNPYSSFDAPWDMYRFMNSTAITFNDGFKPVVLKKEEEEMTMNAMVEYLEKRGFEATKVYSNIDKKYIFEISKNGKYVRDDYKYNPYARVKEIDPAQRKFLDGLIDQWNRAWGGDNFLDKKLNINEKESDMETLETVRTVLDALSYKQKTAVYRIIGEALNSETNLSIPGIKKVIFNDPATIVFWTDNTKTVVRADEEPYDPEKGLAMAIAKKSMGNNYTYYNTFKKWLKKAPGYEM